VDKVKELAPYAVHIQHEYGLYEYLDSRGVGDNNAGFLQMLNLLQDHPLIVEPHTIHGRLREHEAEFVYKTCEAADVVLFKCHYQRWRLDWTFANQDWSIPSNVMIVPHGARSDYRWAVHEVPRLRKELGLDGQAHLGDHLVGLVGWIQNNKRWDILTSMWEEIHDEILVRSGVDWDLLAAGSLRDPNHKAEYEKYRHGVKLLEDKGLAHFYEFVPRGDPYYKLMAICDFIVLPSIDETQSGTLARIIALNKPYITTAPMEGLTAQTLESGGGLLFTNKQMLKQHVITLACDEGLRLRLGDNLRRYLDEVVAWEVVARQYSEAYRLAREAKANRHRVCLAAEF
jgi:1,2-diacylglycerol 3-alpha-glucosyltransferase